MKRFLLGAAAAGMLVTLASCSADEPLSKNNDGTVTFSIQLPEGLQTRTPFGDVGTINVNQLSYSIFDDKGTFVFSNQREAFGPNVLTETESISLVANQQYTVVFYANNTEGFSTYIPSTADVTVDYTKAHVNSELDDAFFAKLDFTADGTNKPVTLNRPFAQINIGTNDLANPAVKAILSQVNSQLTLTTGVFGSFSCLSTNVSEESSSPISFTEPDAPTPGNTNFPVAGYDDLLTCYVLVPMDRQVVNAEFKLNLGSENFNTLTLDNMPVQGNYRTNVYGSLLTTKNVFNITIDPAFGTPDNDLYMGPWDGTVKEPVLDTENKSANIGDPRELAWLAQQLAAADSPYTDYTFTLINDLDLGNLEWTPVGKSTDFTGTFEGNGHTIKNLTVTSGSKIGRFGNVTGTGIVKNVNLKDVNIKGSSSVGALAGYVEGATVENVNVLSGTVSGRGSQGWTHMINQ